MTRTHCKFCNINIIPIDWISGIDEGLGHMTKCKVYICVNGCPIVRQYDFGDMNVDALNSSLDRGCLKVGITSEEFISKLLTLT